MAINFKPKFESADGDMASFINALENRRFLRMLADAMPQIVCTAFADGTINYFNRRWFEFTGLSPETAFSTGGWLKPIHPDDRMRASDFWRTTTAGRSEQAISVRLRGKGGHYRWFLCRAVPLRDSDDVVIRWLATLTDIDEQKRLEERERFLSHVSDVLNSTLDVRTILQRITELCVPKFADWCQIQTLDADDELRVEAAHHFDPDRDAILKRLVGRNVITRDGTLGAPEVVRKGKARQLDHNTTLCAFSANVPDALDRRRYAAAGLGNSLIVPLIARGETFGTLDLVTIDPASQPSESAMEIAGEIALRAALAIDNSRLYEREHRVATALQEAMLPTDLPSLARIAFSSVYRPAERGSEIGGDWYDAFLISRDKVAISIGDVAGHGLPAAVAMSEARQALRLSAVQGLSPAEVLRRTNAMLLLDERETMITAVFGIIDLARMRYTYSCAGHPPPAVVWPCGGVRFLEGGGFPMGVDPDAAFPTRSIALKARSTLVLYTDGLIEFKRNLVEESRRLLDALRERVHQRGSNGAASLLERILDGRQHDDIAILVATILP
ncbi:MAG: SpoIIE family protein phosphatase [Candidatus Eremiobacteraeota bacterium]|nr:SpoIIE family protein phosphatase [Candidatus Eremiobacteraeota bacterium]MBV8355726.1 SpoIIE family protein phosphatase [Candidatus Eremiobacteraeota bacterium]